jgi:hypothetical protein
MSDTRFRDLRIGDSFDFIGPEARFNSFYERCTKVTTRSYEWFHPERHTNLRSEVGTINCKVYHVKRKEGR